MENYFRYFPGRTSDGIHLSGCGFTRIPPSSSYPLAGHPKAHAFAWRNGRILKQWQLVAITEGEGEFDSSFTGLRSLVEGTWFVLKPNCWHRYRPSQSKGWIEHWLELDGAIDSSDVEDLMLNLGERPELISLFMRLHSLARSFAPPKILDSLAIHLFYSALAVTPRKLEDPSYNLVCAAQRLLLENLGTQWRIEYVARKLGIHPATLRRAFDNHLGISPKRYLDELRLLRARDLIFDGTYTLAAIADELGFDSPYHFSNRFKQRFGLAPTAWRKGVCSRRTACPKTNNLLRTENC